MFRQYQPRYWSLLSQIVQLQTDKSGDLFLKRIKVHILLLQEITPTVQFVIFCYNFVYKIQTDSFPRCLSPYSNRNCFGLVQNKKLGCESNNAALSSSTKSLVFCDPTVVRERVPRKVFRGRIFRFHTEKYSDLSKWSSTTFDLTRVVISCR